MHRFKPEMSEFLKMELLNSRWRLAGSFRRRAEKELSLFLYFFKRVLQF